MKILVVDDDLDVQVTLKQILWDNNYASDAIGTSVEALDAVLAQDYSIAIIDIRLLGHLDDRSGIVLAAAILGLKPKTHVILITGYPIEDTTTRALEAMGNLETIILKGADFESSILAAIKRSLQAIEQPETRSNTRFGLSLISNQPVHIRSTGSFICSTRTRRTLKFDAQRWIRRANLARNSSKDERFSWKDIGTELGKTIFGEFDKIASEFNEARSHAYHQSDVLTLTFDVGIEFSGVPLEYIWLEKLDGFLVLHHPVSRFIHGLTPKRMPLSPSLMVEARDLRVLLIGSNTLPSIDGVDQEIDSLEQRFRSNPKTKNGIKVLKTEDCTLDEAQHYLSQPFDIVHYAGHAIFDENFPGESHLLFWTRKNKQGEIKPLKASELRMMLEDSNETRLLYLSCCDGAASATQQVLLDDDSLGFTDAVARAGVPTILGYRWPVSDQGAMTLANEFYNILLRKGSPEIALWKARRMLARQDLNSFDYLSPIMIHQE